MLFWNGTVVVVVCVRVVSCCPTREITEGVSDEDLRRVPLIKRTGIMALLGLRGYAKAH